MSHVRQRSLSIRWQIIIPFIVLTALVTALLIPLTNRILATRLRDESARHLEQIAISAATEIRDTRARLELGASFAASFPEVQFAAVLDQEEPVSTELTPLRRELQVQELSFYSENYEPGFQPTFYGGPEAPLFPTLDPLVLEARDEAISDALRSGRPSSQVVMSPGGGQIFAVVPIVFQSKVEGVLLASEPINRAFMERLSERLDAEIAIAVDNVLVADSLPIDVLRISDVQPVLDTDGTSSFVRQDNQEPLQVLSQELLIDGATLGRLLVMSDENELLAVQETVLYVLGALAVFIALFSLAFGAMMVLHISRPLSRLAEIAQRVSEGDLEQRAPARSGLRDEITVLSERFNEMTYNLQDLYDSLEQRVEDRTAALIAERNKLDAAMHELADARDQALEASRAKSVFLATMSHELRTPLNAIIGYSEMLADEAHEMGYEDITPDLRKITTAGRHLLSLINDILDLSKIEAGRMDLFLETVDLNVLVRDLATTVQPLLESNTNTLTIDLPPDAGTIVADSTKLRQIMLNLLSNAAKFTHAGQITLRLTRELRDEQEMVLFAVTDTGIGLTPEQIQRLFQAFVQADASTTRKYGGTGLGLALSQRLAQLQSGDITVESEIGVGSTFTLLIPADVRSARPQQSDIPAARQIEDEGETQGRLLVIDDDPASRDLLVRHLSRAGYHIDLATSGEQGLDLARALHPDLILLDVLMPGMDGWAVLSALKADPTLADIPVIVLTIVDDRNLGFSLGAADYLLKPIDRQRLVSIVARHVDQAGELGERRVLVVEDDEPTRSMMRRMLEQAGYEVSEASNGQQALERIAAGRVDLVLLDLMMPEMDGFQFLAAARLREELRQLPVIVVTAMDLSPQERRELEGSVKQVLHKAAYSRDELLTEVRQQISTSLSQRQQAE